MESDVYKRIFTFLTGLSSAILLISCTPITATRGNLVEQERLSLVQPGVSKREDVFNALGSPTTVSPFDNNTWYYMGQKTEKRGIFDPSIVDEEIIIVTFNDDNIVSNLSTQDKGRMRVPIKNDETPTYGNDRTAIQRLLGNLGRFNPDAPNK